MARKTTYTSILQFDSRSISMLRYDVKAKKPTDVQWLSQMGNWDNADTLTTAVKTFLAAHHTKGDQLFLILPRYEITTRFLTLPSHDINEIAGMVRFSAEEYVPYALNEMIIDQCILNPLDSGEAHVLAALAHHEVVEKPLVILQKIGVSPVKILLSTACIASAAKMYRSENPFAVVNLSSGGIEIIVIEEGIPVFSRGIATTHDWVEICRNPEAAVSTGLLDAGGTEELASELRGSFAAYRRESLHGLGVEKVFIACAFADVRELCLSLSQKTGKDCQPADFAVSLLGESMTTCAGIPLEFIGALKAVQDPSEPSINLLPAREAEARKIQKAKTVVLRILLFAVLIAAGLGGLYYQAVYQRMLLIKELQKKISLIEPNARGITEKREALNILRRQVERKGSVVEQLATIVESAPDGQVNFSRISLRRGEGISLWGRAKTVSDVAQFTQNIRNRAEGHLVFFSQARSLYEQQTMERDTPVFAYQIDVPLMED